MGYGYATNPAFFEYVQITAINAATGVITFSTPLKYSYKSTWPNYNTGSNVHADQGGPATLYAFDPSWDSEVEFRGLTIDQSGQTYANVRSITYRDVTFTGPACGIPSLNLTWRAINTKMPDCGMEVDKLIDSMTLDGVTIRQIHFQSSSTNLFTMKNSNVTSTINGTPKKTVISDSTIANFSPGAYAYGMSEEVICTNCVMNSVSPLGTRYSNIKTDFTMSNGILKSTTPIAGPQAWAVPGANVMFGGQYDDMAIFQVLDVWKDSNGYTYIKTSLPGGFPSFPIDRVHGHPAPKFTCINCSGSSDALVLSKAPAGAPLGSYYERTDAKPGYGAPSLPVWGKLVSMSFNVTQTYAGSDSLKFMAGIFGVDVINPDGSIVTWNPYVTARAGGTRTVTPTAVTTAQSGGFFVSPRRKCLDTRVFAATKI